MKETEFDYRDDLHGVVINFNEDVQVKTSHFQIEALTLIARIGGIIGVGQTVTWILNICFGKLYIIFVIKVFNDN